MFPSELRLPLPVYSPSFVLYPCVFWQQASWGFVSGHGTGHAAPQQHSVTVIPFCYHDGQLQGFSVLMDCRGCSWARCWPPFIIGVTVITLAFSVLPSALADNCGWFLGMIDASYLSLLLLFIAMTSSALASALVGSCSRFLGMCYSSIVIIVITAVPFSAVVSLVDSCGWFLGMKLAILQCYYNGDLFSSGLSAGRQLLLVPQA